ncbi:MAG: hypothetical protein AAGA80_05590 [Cyanobacteria bacterium P01_F01_bin.143]
MNLFTKSTPKVDLEKLQQIKSWTYHNLAIAPEISISISQLQCHEPDCPTLETVIAVMTNPPRQYKIHKSASEITEEDIKQIANV